MIWDKKQKQKIIGIMNNENNIEEMTGNNNNKRPTN